MEIFCLHHMEWAVGDGSNVWQFESGESIPGWAVWEAGAPARMRICSWWAKIHSSSLLPTAETEEAPGKQISLSKLPVVMGRDEAGEDGDWGYCHCYASARDAQHWGESSQLSPDVGRLKLLNI